MALSMGLLGASVPGPIDAYDLLVSTILTGSQSSITLADLNTYAADYQHLQIRYSLKSSVSNTGDRLRLKVNGANSSLNRHGLLAFASSTTSFYTGTDGDSLVVSDRLDSVNFSPGVLDILDFGSTTKTKTLKFMHGFTSPSFDLPQVQIISVLWNSTSALTSLTFGAGNTGFANSFVAGSRMSIYGLKAGV